MTLQRMASLVALAALTSLSIDIYLPSMQAMASDLKVPVNQIQAGLNLFILGFALGQLVLGPLSDRWGRRPPLLIALAIYVVSSWMCGSTLNIEVFLISRAIQGLSASCGTVSAMAIVRDLSSGTIMTQTFARMAMAIGLAPILAPNLGAALGKYWGWQASFWFLFGFGSLLWIWVFFRLPESLKQTISNRGLGLADFIRIAQNRTFLRFSTFYCLGFSGLFAFISSAGPILMGGRGVSAQHFALLFGSNALIYIAGSYIASWLAKRLPLNQLAILGSSGLLLGGLLMLAFHQSIHLLALMAPMYLATLGIALLMPVGSSGALQPFSDQAGRAAALQGFFRFVMAAGLAFLISQFDIHSALPLAVAILGCGLVCGMVCFLGKQTTEIASHCASGRAI